ncbi:TGF-beta-activated kinase 1 and MAP3K7-binding protein 2, partial [Orchesella cincta]
LITAQTERKDKLRTAITDRKHLLTKLQTEIVQLRSQLQLNPFSELEKLKQENQRLRIECDFMAREVDLYENGSVPLGETSEEFYQGINPGQSVDALFGITNNRRKIGNVPPPRPPPPKFLHSPDAMGSGVGGQSPDGEWRCSMCTFQNHRDLDFCEQCNMVRVKHGPSREQNIRIRVVRHQQPQQRRVVHSWVMLNYYQRNSPRTGTLLISFYSSRRILSIAGTR